jgi:hypothetical protein
VAHYAFDADDWPEPFLFRGTGSMNYPEGEMQYVWEGRGTAGSSADCLITADEIRLRPKKVFRAVQGWPEFVLKRDDIREVERMFFGRCRFRSERTAVDGACFRPIGGRQAFLAALDTLGIPVIEASTRDKVAFERRITWNQMRWGGRLRRRRWKRDQHEPA